MTQKEIIDKPSSIAYVKRNWAKKSNREMADHLGVCIQYVRDVSYDLGLYRMRLEKWTDDQVALLKQLYKTTGDKELAIIFNKEFKRKKAWTFKHIEKKRNYLNFHRTPEQLKKIKRRNVKRGAWLNTTTWETRGEAPDGTVKIWNHSYRSAAGPSQFKVIKVNGKWVHYARWLYIQNFGKFKKGHVVGFKDRDNMNVVPENLEQITRAENARRNGDIRKMPDELKSIFQTLKQLNNAIQIKRHETSYR